MQVKREEEERGQEAEAEPETQLPHLVAGEGQNRETLFNHKDRVGTGLFDKPTFWLHFSASSYLPDHGTYSTSIEALKYTANEKLLEKGSLYLCGRSALN